jgi:hypothetical protein
MDFLQDKALMNEKYHQMSQEQLLTHELKERALKTKKDLILARDGPITKVLGR